MIHLRYRRKLWSVKVINRGKQHFQMRFKHIAKDRSVDRKGEHDAHHAQRPPCFSYLEGIAKDKGGQAEK